MRIDIVFDTVCPWCFIGKRRLARAMATRPLAAVEVRWRPFLLNPDIPSEGLDRALYLERKFGSPYRILRIHRAVSEAGQEIGIPFNFAAIRKTPNSLNSHRLIQWACEDERQEDLVERIFRAYFIEGRDIGDTGVLVELAEEAGFDGTDAARYLDEKDEGVIGIEADAQRVRRWGVSGVPCFVFDQRYAVAGAQEVEMLTRLIDIVRETTIEEALV